MGFQKKKFGWGVGGWRKLYPSFVLDFWICFNFAKPLSATSSILDRKSATFLKHNCCTDKICFYSSLPPTDMGNCQIKLQIGEFFVPASYRSNLSL